MVLRRLMLHIRSQNWFAVSLDFLVVVIGLFIGLQVDTWWETRQESRLEDSYLLEIREDFEANKSKLNESIGGLERIIQSILVLHEQAALDVPGLSIQDLNNEFRSISSMPVFFPVNRAYANLTGSGDLRLIGSRPLKNALADFYAASEVTILVQNTHEMELVQIYEPYMIENLDYAGVQRTRVEDFSLPPPLEDSLILDLIGTRKFRNILTQKWVITTDLLNNHRNMLERTKKVLKLLETGDNE
jgi:hypothetical protein